MIDDAIVRIDVRKDVTLDNRSAKDPASGVMNNLLSPFYCLSSFPEDDETTKFRIKTTIIPMGNKAVTHEDIKKLKNTVPRLSTKVKTVPTVSIYLTLNNDATIV